MWFEVRVKVILFFPLKAIDSAPFIEKITLFPLYHSVYGIWNLFLGTYSVPLIDCLFFFFV